MSKSNLANAITDQIRQYITQKLKPREFIKKERVRFNRRSSWSYDEVEVIGHKNLKSWKSERDMLKMNKQRGRRSLDLEQDILHVDVTWEQMKVSTPNASQKALQAMAQSLPNSRRASPAWLVDSDILINEINLATTSALKSLAKSKKLERGRNLSASALRQNILDKRQRAAKLAASRSLDKTDPSLDEPSAPEAAQQQYPSPTKRKIDISNFHPQTFNRGPSTSRRIGQSMDDRWNSSENDLDAFYMVRTLPEDETFSWESRASRPPRVHQVDFQFEDILRESEIALQSARKIQTSSSQTRLIQDRSVELLDAVRQSNQALESARKIRNSTSPIKENRPSITLQRRSLHYHTRERPNKANPGHTISHTKAKTPAKTREVSSPRKTYDSIFLRKNTGITTEPRVRPTYQRGQSIEQTSRRRSVAAPANEKRKFRFIKKAVSYSGLLLLRH